MITVLFATLNGARLLPGVFEAYARLRVPSGGWQLIVADNGSTDQTREVVRSFATRLPLRYVFEAQPGKNAALNAALPLTEGELLVLTDDDVFPHADWLERLSAAATAHPAFGVFGGRILPRWEVPPQQWLLDCVHAAPTFALTEPSLPDGPTGPQNIFGPNMALRSSLLGDGVRFDTSIGPRGRSYAMGSETELVRRLLRAGQLAWHVRDAVVEHFIRKSQMERSWVLERAVRFGRGQYRLALAEDAAPPKTWWSVPRYLFRLLANRFGATLLATLSGDARRLFTARWNFNVVRGAIIEAWQCGCEVQSMQRTRRGLKRAPDE